MYFVSIILLFIIKLRFPPHNSLSSGLYSLDQAFVILTRIVSHFCLTLVKRCHLTGIAMNSLNYPLLSQKTDTFPLVSDKDDAQFLSKYPVESCHFTRIAINRLNQLFLEYKIASISLSGERNFPLLCKERKCGGI